jgi:hypothetical protein
MGLLVHCGLEPGQAARDRCDRYVHGCLMQTCCLGSLAEACPGRFAHGPAALLLVTCTRRTRSPGGHAREAVQDFDPDTMLTKQETIRLFFLHRPPIKVPRAPAVLAPDFVRSRCPPFCSLFFRSFSTTQTGEALSAYTLHHRHHAVVLSIPTTTPPYLAGPGRRSRWRAVHVQLSEAPPLAA